MSAGSRSSGKAGAQKLRLFDVALLALAFALTTYWSWTYTGLYRWIAQWQVEYFGQYSPGLTYMITVFALILPVVFGERFLAQRRSLHPALYTGARPRATPAARTARRYRPSFEHLRDLKAWAVASLGLALLFLLLCSRDLATLEDGPPQAATVADLRGQSVFAARYVAAIGEPLFQSAVSLQEGESVPPQIYVPFVRTSPDLAKTVLLDVFLVAPGDAFEALLAHPPAEHSFRGIARFEPVPNLVIEALRRDGFQVASLAVFVRLSQRPSDQLYEAHVFCAVGVACLLLAPLLWWAGGRSERRSLKRALPPG